MLKSQVKSIYIRLLSYFNKFSLSSPSQLGFTKGRSTQDAILDSMEQNYDALNYKEISISVFIDYKKVFDTANHNNPFSSENDMEHVHWSST